MRMITAGILSLCLVALGGILLAQQTDKPIATEPAKATEAAAPLPPASPLSFTVLDIHGKPVDLSSYRGKVVLIVNVASKCGNTPQYKQLQALYAKYGKQGLAILAFPANNFGGQEPGTNEEIAAFCTMNYGVTFDVFGKLSAAGDDIAPLYRFLTDAKTNPQFAGPIAWNFTKFLVDRDGQVVNRFAPNVVPDDPKVVAAVEAELAKARGPLSFVVKNNAGQDVDLLAYRGKVALVVNVASKCGYTPQYKQLQALYDKYGKQGLAILAFPANNFGGQEPGTDQEIATFCTGTFGVTFDLFSKISAKGDDIAPLYRHLTDTERYPKTGGPIAWNFTKFLIGRDGQVISRFEPKVAPDSPEVVQAIETALGAGKGADVGEAAPVDAPPAKTGAWHDSLTEALAEAKARKTLVLVDFHAEWCGWCHKLEQDTLSDAGVQARLRDFTLVKIDTDANPELAEKYGVTGLPTTMVLTADGKVVKSQPGYLPPKEYLAFLAKVKK